MEAREGGRRRGRGDRVNEDVEAGREENVDNNGLETVVFSFYVVSYFI